MLSHLLVTLAIVPLAGLIACILVPKNQERTVFAVAITTVLLQLALFLAVGWSWLANGGTPLLASLGSLYSSAQYTFSINFYFDTLSAVFLGIATLVTTLVFIFSKYYMHREPGFKRFYYTVLLFLAGLTLIILAGNFEVLLVGWELIGISSVLLIAFYRDRYLPARNALKVFSVYRIADAFLLAAIWYAHHIFEKSVDFSEFSAAAAHHGDQLALLSILLLMVALIKSAQFPFSYWLPRAMEGPTSSSAIFYGALSVHMGLFLLLRTYPLWEGTIWLHIAIGAVGAVTAVVASSIARVQSSIKTQIAYASVTQIGIMFIEIAAGLWWLALIHFVSNALLRTYQLLISPSVVGYLVHDQFFSFTTPPQRIKNTMLGRLRASLYILGIKEWNMNTAANRFLWKPLKFVGRVFAFLDKPYVQLASAGLFLAALITAITHPDSSAYTAAISASVISLVFYVRAYTTKGSAKISWNLVMIGNLFGILALISATVRDWQYLIMYGTGVVVAFIAGHIVLGYLQAKGELIGLRRYRGAIYTFKKLGRVFFVICLLFMAFPISPSFLAQDILLSFIPENRALLVLLFCFGYLMAGVSIMRLYTKVFLGPHKTSHHEKAYKSS